MRQAAKIDSQGDPPVLILTISNGAGHIRTAQGIGAAIHAIQPSLPVMIADVADYMTQVARFTHVTAYLWLVKHAPAVWDRIDRYQKQQTHTSPEWFYRRGCRDLFELAKRVRPCALVAAEVGCCEIAALIKRDFKLKCPLVAVNVNYDADRAWVQPEVDLYCMATDEAGAETIGHGAQPDQVVTWGVPLSSGFAKLRSREVTRREVCEWLELDASRPLLLIAGGSEGMGRIEAIAERLLRLDLFNPQLIVLTGRNARLQTRCEKLARRAAAQERMRVLSWTERVPALMAASDLLVSKLGNTFDEALASELPIVALEPPPGSERVQYRLLERWNTGRAVRTLDELAVAVSHLLEHREALEEMRVSARSHRKMAAAERIAKWLGECNVSASRADDLAEVDRLARAC